MLLPIVLEELSRADSEIKFPDYKLGHKSPFKCRADLLAYEAVLELENQVAMLIREAVDTSKADTQRPLSGDLPEGDVRHPLARERLLKLLYIDILPRWRTYHSIVPAWMQWASPGKSLSGWVVAY